MTPKSGVKTTEFWMSVAGVVIGSGMLILGALADEPELIEAGKWILPASLLGYPVARGMAKLPER